MSSNYPPEYMLVRWNLANARRSEMKIMTQLETINQKIIDAQEVLDNLYKEAESHAIEINICQGRKTNICQRLIDYLETRKPAEALAERAVIEKLWDIQEEILVISSEFTSVLEEEHIEDIRLNPHLRSSFYYTDEHVAQKLARLDRKKDLEFQHRDLLDYFLKLHHKHSPTGTLTFDGYIDGDVNAGPQFSLKN